MGDVTPFRRPINWSELRADEAERIVRSRAVPGNTGKVIISNHAWDRIDQREITREDVFQILRNGFCHGPPKKNEFGNWQVMISRRMAGHREAGVVTVILEDGENLVVRTVEWIDPK